MLSHQSCRVFITLRAASLHVHHILTSLGLIVAYIMPERSVILSTLVPTMPQEELDRRTQIRNAYTKLPADQKYADVDRVLDAPGPFTDEAFQGGDTAKQFLRHTCKVLVIGAGGLGCEILQNLALSMCLWSIRLLSLTLSGSGIQRHSCY